MVTIQERLKKLGAKELKKGWDKVSCRYHGFTFVATKTNWIDLLKQVVDFIRPLPKQNGRSM